VPVIGATDAEALELDAELERLIKPEYARLQLAQTLRVPPETLQLDAELPSEISADDNSTEAAKSRYALIVNRARRERLTVRKLIGRLGGGRGHRTFATPEQVADALQHWFENGAADGFNIMAPVFPSGLEKFVDHVVPILQQRGLFRTEYEGTTLREHYGLARPDNANRQRGRLAGAAE
jgi:alkanesulfonate monooxygenase SsuD/methylene tetrahydromethanopterin reductase-like flavin-dependent oxidoreductase (luciferase family)